jgi:hypothetical protein
MLSNTRCSRCFRLDSPRPRATSAPSTALLRQCGEVQPAEARFGRRTGLGNHSEGVLRLRHVDMGAKAVAFFHFGRRTAGTGPGVGVVPLSMQTTKQKLPPVIFSLRYTYRIPYVRKRKQEPNLLIGYINKVVDYLTYLIN